MKFLTIIICTFFVFSACKNSLADEEAGDTSSSVYKEVVSSKMDVSSVADRKTELYLFVYNTGDDVIYNDAYKNLFAGKSRSAVSTEFEGGGIIPHSENECEYYTCGLSSEYIRKAYKESRSFKSMARAVGEGPYFNRAKNKAAAKVGDSDKFYVLYEESYGEISRPITATCKYVNDCCQIFVQDNYFVDLDDRVSVKEGNAIKITTAGVKKMAEKFSMIYKAEQALFGNASLDEFNINNVIETSEKITILISDIGGDINKALTVGYFNPNDFFCDNTNNPDSNQRMMFTINTNSYFEKYGEELIYTTLGHEFNHMLNYINKTIKYDLAWIMWYTEMLSAISEDFTPYYLEIENTIQKQRIPDFNLKSHNGMVQWNNSEDIFASYGFAYAFGAYLLRNYGGGDLVYQMATNDCVGKEAITKALQSCGYNENFESVLLKFGLVMVNADGKDSSIPTLNKDVSGNIGGYSYNFPAINLYDFDSNLSSAMLKYFNNPHWTFANHKGPCFYNYNCYPANLYGNAFYAVYLGKAHDWDYSLKFNPPAGKLKAYIYVHN